MSRHYVYILISEQFPRKYYVGITHDLEQRLTEHNQLKCAYSKRYAPWRLETYIAFSNETLANKFEKYLKQGSGHAFLKKHLI
jgi:predicted GIY-YIG superfamily endonuclease